jgi:tRNA pseudouridine38-40 synthase
VERTVRLDLAYDGTGFRGWASQRDPAIRTVEGTLSGALGSVLGERVKLSVAGRTDAGVHARGQVASFRTGVPADLARVRDSINGMLGPEIVATGVRGAPGGFDARFSATARQYRYVIRVGEVPDPFSARFEWFRPGALAVGTMRTAARYLVGEHDFTSFCRHPGKGKPTVRRVERVAIVSAGERVEISIRANAFLHQMVRSIVGMLVAVGDGKRGPEEVADVLAARDRAKAGQLAPAQGLTLEWVVYGTRVRVPARSTGR